MSNLSQFLGGGTNKATAITASGSFAQPNNVQFVTVMLVGGGCGGMASAVSYIGGGGGGGGAIAFYDHVYLTGSLTVSIGVGGTGATTAPVAAGAGGDTTITSNHPGSPTFTAQGNPATTRLATTDARYGYIGKHNLGSGNITIYPTDASGRYSSAISPQLVNRGSNAYSALGSPFGTLIQAYGGQSSHPFYGGGYGGTAAAAVATAGADGQYSGLGVLGGAGGNPGGVFVGAAGGGGGGAGIGLGGAGGVGDGSAASANTGGGGGGGGQAGTARNGGAGGSGYAMIFYVG